MSIKKLFDSNKTNDILVSTNLEEEVVKNVPELESADNVREQIERINRFIPQVDYSDPANFAVYGSAERYYRDSFHRVATQYPYDGSEEEITRYNNESNYLDLHILENEYPRTLGHVRFPTNNGGGSATNQFGQQTNAANITFFGGPNAIAGGMTTGSFHLQFTGSNYYDTDIYQTDGTLALDRVGSRESNLTYNLPSKGLTVEFWQGTEGNLISATGPFGRQSRHALFDLWNGEASSSAQYGRLTVYASGSSSAFKGIYLNAYSGTVGIQELELLDPAVAAQIPPQYVNTSSPTPGHLAFAFSSGSTLGLTVKTYINGVLTTTTGSSVALNEVTGALRGRIGALLTNPSGTSIGTDMDGYGTSIRSAYDEFRYWKAERTEKEIQQNYWTQVRGGTNNEIANAELGVYYKFNEGITGDATTDTTVLDYSGRITNGTITNYGTDATTTLVRNANLLPERSSLIVAAGAATSEFKDPIIYASHPDVVSALDRLVASGSVHDFENQASIKDSIPSWIIEEDETSGGEELGKLTQILGSYMDTLNLQIESLPTLADNTYLSGSDKPTPFMKNLLSSRGLAVPEIFVDADLLQRFANRSDTEGYTLDINDTKNLIYKNIYNNLIYLYKSKGTEKAFRNLIRCYGIGEDVIRFNAYASNQTFDIQETRQDRVIRKNYVDFNHPDRFDGVVYQRANTGETTGISFFSASSPNNAFAQTAELEVIFPRKMEFANSQYFDTPFVTASLYGKASASADPAIFDAAFSNNPATAPWLVAYAVRTQQNSNDAYFVLDSNLFTNPLTSDIYSNIYDNQKWNLAIRVKSKNWPYSTGSVASGDGAASFGNQEVSFVGYNVENGVVRNSFVLTTSSISSNLGPSLPYRYFVGSQRTNYTGAVGHQTDILASSLRVYTTFLDDDVIKSHALDPENYGTRNPSRNLLFYNDSDDASLNPAIKTTIPESVSLALNWDYSQVTTTDATGRFSVQDASSGSTGLTSRYPQENVLTNVNKQFAGRGQFGVSAYSSTDVISKQFVQSAQQRLPEVVNTNDDVNVLSRDDELYPRDASISQTYYTFEKSMYGIVSQEMINMFSSIVEFNNLIGEVVHKYRGEYKSLRLLRELFFEKIQNNPDLDKFIDYYHWIDSSLNIFLQQFAPASADVSDEIRTIVEDYVLNRSKYQHKYNQIKQGDSGTGTKAGGFDETILEGRVKGTRELQYDWQFGHAPLTNSQTEHSLWWKDRAERNNTAFNTAALIDTAREDILTIIQLFNSASAPSLNDGTGASGIYEGSAYATRRFTRQYKLDTAIVPDIGGGYNYPRNHKPDALFPLMFDQPLDLTNNIEQVNFEKQGMFTLPEEELRPVIKQEKRRFTAINPETPVGTNGATVFRASSVLAGTKFVTPFIIFSSSVSPAGGYGQQWQTYQLKPDFNKEEFAGYHNDSYGDDYEVPMQGPFTNHHVGGNRHRHTDLNKGSDTALNRAEAWELDIGNSEVGAAKARGASDGSINTNMPGSNPNYRRDETAKRPVNTKNIKHRTGSLGTVAMGNYSASYEIVQTTGRTQNNSAFVKSEGIRDNFTISVAGADEVGYIDHVTDYAKPIRRRTEHVIVNRFSAPGGPETAGDSQGGPGLDFEAAELSPYNNLNYRNTTVRDPLETLLSEHSAQFGLRSGSIASPIGYSGSATNVTASFHKVNRNPLHRLEGYDTGSDTPVTGTVFDNYYVQHMIPRSDFQYAWITASSDRFNSAFGAANNVYGYFPYDGLARVSSSANGFRYESAVNFVSASEIGSVPGTITYSTTTTATETLTGRGSLVSKGVYDISGSSGSFAPAANPNDHFIPQTTHLNIGGIYGDLFSTFVGPKVAPFTYLPSRGGNPSAIDKTHDFNSSLTFLTNQVLFGGNLSDPQEFIIGQDREYVTQWVVDTVLGVTPFDKETGTGGYIFNAAGAPYGRLYTSPSAMDNTRFQMFQTLNKTYGRFESTNYVKSVGSIPLAVAYPPEVGFNKYGLGTLTQPISFTNGNPLFTVSNMIETSASRGAGLILNSLLTKRNGYYGHPTWKQIRVGETGLVRYHRKNNYYSHTYDPVIISSQTDPTGGRAKVQSRTENILISQSVVTDRYFPVVFELEARDDQQNSKVLKSTNVVARTSFANDVITFDNQDVVDRLLDADVLEASERKTSYRQIVDDFSIYDSFLDEQKPILQINSLKYRETVYPPRNFAYTSLTRGRNNFSNNFWRDARSDRTWPSTPPANAENLTEYSKTQREKNTNSQGQGSSNVSFQLAPFQSRWALDGLLSTTNQNNLTTLAGYPTGGINANNADGYKPGELQNLYTHFVRNQQDDFEIDRSDDGEIAQLRAGALYARKHINPYTSSVCGMSGMRKQIDISAFIFSGTSYLLLTSSIGAGEAFWDAPNLAGRYEGTSSVFVKERATPFYDDYDAFYSDIKTKTRGRSIIPEFRIEDHIDFYEQNGFDYLTENPALFQFPGVPSQEGYLQNSGYPHFFKIFTNSDFMQHFEVVREDGLKEGGILEPAKVKLRCKAVKKFVPYDGFYPAERTLQLASAFSASYAPLTQLSSSTGAENTYQVAWRTMLKPFFAPGIVYNTIKSGVAVDYPIMTGSYNVGKMIMAGDGASANTGVRMVATASAGIFSNSRNDSKNGLTGLLAGFNIVSHNDGWDYRVPFETVLEPGKYIYGKNIVDDEPSAFAGINVTASWGSSEQGTKYKNMMHNFLASSLDVFIKDGKPTEILSAPQKEFKAVTPGQPYGMRIKMYRSFESGSQQETSGDWGDFQVPQYISGSLTDFTMYSRPSAFGPPVLAGTGSQVMSQQKYCITGSREMTPARGRYASHTPPYFDGESWIDLIYYPYKSFDSGSTGLEVINNTTRTVTVSDLHNLASTEFSSGSAILDYEFGQGSRFGGEGTYVVRWRFDQEALRTNFSTEDTGSTYHGTGSDIGPMGGPWANRWAMHLDASLNIFSKARGVGSLAAEAVSADLAESGLGDGSFNAGDDRWRIQTKFETPMLNFGYLGMSDITFNGTIGSLNDYQRAVNSVVPRGMWHQFGRIPRDAEGVYIQVTDIPDNFINNHPSSSIIFDPAGKFDLRNAVSEGMRTFSIFAKGGSTNSAEAIDAVAKDLNGYKIPQNMKIDRNAIDNAAGRKTVSTTDSPLSLVDICGFPTEPVRIGEMPSSKTIFEAVVAVPFIDVDGDKEFFNVPVARTEFEKPFFDKAAGNSILRQQRLMEKYVFPPTFDFVQNDAVEPIAMYIFEFSHKLSQDDLSHIWQNLSPKIGTRCEEAMATVSHPLLANQLLNFNVLDALEADEQGIKPPRVEFPEELQWMVFKVKQRAKSNYFKQIESSERADIPFYTSNWPYDFFSLIEVADIDAEVEFKPTQNNLDMKKQKREAAQNALNDRTSRDEAVDVGPAGD